MAQAAGYSFNTGTVAGSKVKDLAGYHLHGTLIGSASVGAGGKYGDALHVTGGALRTQVVSSGHQGYAVDFTGGLTVAAWVKLDDTTAALRTIASAAVGSTLHWAAYASNAAGNVALRIGSTTYTTSSSIRDGNWHHVLMVLNQIGASSTWEIVVDGTSQASGTLTTELAYTGTVTMEAGRNAATAGEPLNGWIDDLRWWNDPVYAASWSDVMATEQQDTLLGAYTFDWADVDDFSSYGRHLTSTAAASFGHGRYGRALVCGGGQQAAHGAVQFGDVDRLFTACWMRIDTLPAVESTVWVIEDSGGTPLIRASVLPDGNLRLACTFDNPAVGTRTTTTTTPMPVGEWRPVAFGMNPTYVSIQHGTTSEVQTGAGATPTIEPVISGLHTLRIGGDATHGAQVSLSYLSFTQNFIHGNMLPYYYGGITLPEPARPGNAAVMSYVFEDGTGTTVTDTSGNGNHLTLLTPGVWKSDGVAGYALGVLRTGGMVGAGARNNSFTWPGAPLKGFCVSVWARLTAAQGSGARFLVLNDSSGNAAIQLGRLNGYGWFRTYDTAGQTTGLINYQSGGVPSFPENSWQHFAVVFDGLSYFYYRNGVRYNREYAGNMSHLWDTIRSPGRIFVGGDDGADAPLADVDDLYVYDTPLGPSEIEWLYLNPGTPPLGAVGSLSLSGAAVLGGAVAASGSITLSGAGEAETATPITATGSLDLSGAASPAAPVTAAGSLVLSGAQASLPLTAAASGSLVLSGTAEGLAALAAAGSLVLSGSADGLQPVTASGSLALSGTATVEPVMLASGTLSLSGTAAAASTGAAGSGSLLITGTADGLAPVTATGTLDLSGQTGGGSPLSHSTGSLALSGSATLGAGLSATGSVVLTGAGVAEAGQGPITSTGTLTLSGSAALGGTLAATGTFLIAGAMQTYEPPHVVNPVGRLRGSCARAILRTSKVRATLRTIG